MINLSISRALWEIPSSAVAWPATTKPWFSATLVHERGTPHAYLQSVEADSGTDLAAHLHANEGELVHILAGIPYGHGWDIRFISEVHIGKLGDAAVVVVRDTEGTELCPDSPAIPVSSLAELVCVGTVIARERQSRAAPVPSLGQTVHSQVVKARTAEPLLPGSEVPVRAAQAQA
ncbi:hypothetical protein ACG02S_00970 [Roseateles sp. DC23W]|uniref:Uncharacterized protein n=1 Tax=Pelomonas dachongensis TaxID=3299029 RepID=A0ABW7EG71_9BURK